MNGNQWETPFDYNNFICSSRWSERHITSTKVFFRSYYSVPSRFWPLLRLAVLNCSYFFSKFLALITLSSPVFELSSIILVYPSWNKTKQYRSINNKTILILQLLTNIVRFPNFYRQFIVTLIFSFYQCVTQLHLSL